MQHWPQHALHQRWWLVAAVAGSSTIPQEWIDQSDEAARANPYSCSRLTIWETTDGMMGALQAKAEKAQRLGERLMERLLTNR